MALLIHIHSKLHCVKSPNAAARNRLNFPSICWYKPDSRWP
ncbi:hypothetical protein M7I_1639 [Glarea lozoyensis 74030]|uniref:Uncharacterized protein n=1 Tax=Glarea lozoyensis (strain ATCC 74030 / MF5533) TaxID=1104152 RepID=H0EGM2_GLAL7|nr:hypothetical protein M7I_1639 [Glarea lozoyensis 74030]